MIREFIQILMRRSAVSIWRPCVLMLIAVLACGSAAAEEPPPSAADLAFFEAKIRPQLIKHCYQCHAGENDEGGLRLDTQKATRSGGNRGPAVVPGNPDESWLLTAIQHEDADLQMPPKRDKLSAAVIADFTKWINRGAADSRTTASTLAKPKPGAKFWAYQPPASPEPPTVSNPDWPRGEIDHFILARLEAKGLAPSADASPAVLLRRVSFDLLGLPPSPEELNQFQQAIRADGLESALAEMVDWYLASPHFGERWGRHWLDVARFAESSGNEANISFPYAWRYRDYVIDAFNHDLPFDRFLTEQIAGDLLPADSPVERARLLIATGYLAVGAKNLDEANVKQFEADLIDEQIDAVSRGVMASSLACARCHDHKFDPFSMDDYYAVAGIFTSTKTFFGTAVSPANRVGGDPLELPAAANALVLHRSIAASEVEKLKAEMAKLQEEEKRGREAVYKAVAEGKDPSGLFTLTDALRIFWRTGQIEGQLEKVGDDGVALPLAMGVLDQPSPTDATLLIRGEIGRPGKVVSRGLPAVVGRSNNHAIPAEASGRLQLAAWLTSSKHPLTKRVYVNRIWRQLFGAGIVATVDNFGSTGSPPSHPALLDHLARQFEAEGWSTKKLIRSIVLSRAYRQASDFREAAFTIDPENRLLWRTSKRRLQAEAIRDAMLSASGELERSRPEASLVAKQIGDRPISLIGLDKRIPKDLDGSLHRTVYLPVLRDRLPDVLDLFDFADPSRVTGDRETTNTPTQAHYLMNSSFVEQRAAAMAQRLLSDSDNQEGVGDESKPSDNRERIKRAFLLCFSRQPDAKELARATAFVQTVSKQQAAHEDPVESKAKAASRTPLAQLCRALFAAAEFRNLD